MNKLILVTGASSGLGRKLCIELDKIGTNLVLTGKNKEELKKTFNLLEGKKNTYIPYDLNKIDNIKTFLSKVFSNNRRFDGFVHCAGVHSLTPINFIKSEYINETFNVNVFAPILIIKELSKKQNFNINASIIFVSSIMSSMGASSLSIYSSSKAAQIGLVKSLAVELSKKKIRVNAVSASLLNSKILDKLKKKLLPDSWTEIEKKHLLGFGKYEDIIPTIIHLLSSESNWTTGSNLIVDGGYSSW